MAVVINGTGPVVPTSAVRIGSSHNTYAYCSPVQVVGSTYDSQLDFGVQLSEVVIVNLGTKAAAFQWAGASTDCGVVPPGGQVQFKKAMKAGISVRCADTGTTTVVVFGI